MTAEKVFKEKFVSPFGRVTKEGANEVLNDIRKAHPEEKGWREIEAYTEQHEDGKWYAVRIHEKHTA